MEENEKVEVHYVCMVEETIVNVGGENCEKVSHERLKNAHEDYKKRYSEGGFEVVVDDLGILHRITKVFHETAQALVELGLTRYPPGVRLDFESGGEMLQEEYVTLSAPFPGEYEDDQVMLKYTMVDPSKLFRIISFFEELGINGIRMKFDKEDPEMPILFETLESETMNVQALLMPGVINLDNIRAMIADLEEDIENEKESGEVA